MGSNIFNLLSVLGVTAIVHPLTMPDAQFKGIWIMLGVSVGMVILALVKPAMGRLIGGAFLLLYAVYTLYVFMG